MAKTFAQYLIDRTLPPDMAITRQVDKSAARRGGSPVP